MSSFAEEPDLGGLNRRIADLWADKDAQRMRELNEDIKARRHEHEVKLCPCGCLAPLGACSERAQTSPPPPAPSVTPVNHAAPARAKPAKEATMPKGIRSSGPCPGCGTKSTNCQKGCPERAKREGAPQVEHPRPAPRRSGPETMSVDELLELRAGIDQELAHRERQAEEQLEAIRAARRGTKPAAPEEPRSGEGAGEPPAGAPLARVG